MAGSGPGDREAEFQQRGRGEGTDGEGEPRGGGDATDGEGEPRGGTSPGGRSPSGDTSTDGEAESRAGPTTYSAVCDLCGTMMYGRHCKLVCRQCGYVRDCSDP